MVDIFREHYNRDDSKIKFTQIRPGEKIDEMLICKEELSRTQRVGDVFVIHDILTSKQFNDLDEELSSGSPGTLLSRSELVEFLTDKGIFND